MNEAEYISQINYYRNQICCYQGELASVKKQIDEAEEALREARSYSTKFYDSVDDNKDKSNRLIINNGLKSLLGLSNRLKDMLTGAQFYNADQSVQEMILNIKNELANLYAEYNRYEDLIGGAQSSLDQTYNQLNAYRRNQEAIRLAEAERLEQQRLQAAQKNNALETTPSASQKTNVGNASNPLNDIIKSIKGKWR